MRLRDVDGFEHCSPEIGTASIFQGSCRVRWSLCKLHQFVKSGHPKRLSRPLEAHSSQMSKFSEFVCTEILPAMRKKIRKGTCQFSRDIHGQCETRRSRWKQHEFRQEWTLGIHDRIFSQLNVSWCVMNLQLLQLQKPSIFCTATFEGSTFFPWTSQLISGQRFWSIEVYWGRHYFHLL